MRASRVVNTKGRTDTAIARQRVDFIYRHAGNLSSAEIAEQLGITPISVRNIAASHDISLKLRPAIEDTDYPLIVQLQSEGMPDDEIAEKWDCTITTLCRFMRKRQAAIRRARYDPPAA